MAHIAPAALQPRRATSLGVRLFAELVVASIGATLLICVAVATQAWLDRHFVPSFFLPRHTYVALQTCGRVMMTIVGAWLVFVARPRVGRFAARSPRRAFEILIAIALALG